jgi:hypothetical protein
MAKRGALELVERLLVQRWLAAHAATPGSDSPGRDVQHDGRDGVRRELDVETARAIRARHADGRLHKTRDGLALRHL